MKANLWNVTPKEAFAIQNTLKERVSLVPLTKPVRYIGGADVSMNQYAPEGFAGFVTLDYASLQAVDHKVSREHIKFPYIPGLLSFREIPMLLNVWERLKIKPDVLVVDGIGIAHPRRMGIATHLGLVLNIPTIGCAKSVLTGVYEEPANVAGATSPLCDRYNKTEVIGMAVRTKVNVKPVFISPGHLITLEESVTIIKHCVRKHRLPEPTRLAHLAVNEYRIKGK